MAVITIDVSVTGEERLARLAGRLRAAANGGLQRKLTASVRRDGTGALRATRAAWRGVEVTSTRGGGSSSGLRARVAAATEKNDITHGVLFEVEPSAVDPAYGKTLTFGLNGMGRWRHPVFGNTHKWTTQVGQEVFLKTLRGYEPRWRAGLERVCDEVARQIEG